MMDWKNLLTTTRLGQETRHTERRDDRSEFKRDYDRLIFSAPFRRMQNKTQVFPLPGSIFVHNRLTHSLEVASVGMSLGNDVARKLTARTPELKDTLIQEIGTIVSTACLAHDMGNPPFGHSGEKAIQTFFTEGKGSMLRDLLSPEVWDDVTNFDGNANTFRLLAHRFLGRRDGGFVMTYPTLASTVKYPYESGAKIKPGKFGFFTEDKEIYRKIAERLGIPHHEDSNGKICYARYPLVFLVEAADDICYEIMDIEDANKLKILSYDETAQLLLNFFSKDVQDKILQRIIDEGITDNNEKIIYMRACVIGKLENLCVDAFVDNEEKILSGTFTGSLIDHIPEYELSAYRACQKVSKDKIYHSKPVLDIELSGFTIMETLMEKLIDAAFYPKRFYSQQLMRRVASQYDIHSKDLETRIMAVIDYISGMTDVYALDVYQKISGISLPKV